jgi:hypothetical protein
MSHAETLHSLLCAPTAVRGHPSAAQALSACRAHIAACTPCTTPTRPDDLALQMFIEAADLEWNRDGAGQPSELRRLFAEYLAAGFIRLDTPVCRTTARRAIGVTSNPPPDMTPLEVAIRRSSVATAVSLLEEGADESKVPYRKTVDGPQDLMSSAWLLPDNRDVAPAMAAAVADALMRRRIRTEAANAPDSRTPRRRLGV